jgi:two-component system, OmpR family, sensor kinase
LKAINMAAFRYSWRRGLSVVMLVLLGFWIPLLLLRVGFLPNLMIYGSFEVDLKAVLFLVGVLGILIVMIGVTVWLRDTTLIQRARMAEYQRRSMAHRDFLRRLDHELKNPLTTIRIGLLNVQQVLLPEQQGSLARITQQTQRLQNLVEDLRYLTQIEEYKLDPAPVALQDVLENAIALVCENPEYQDRVIDLQFQQIPWALPDVWGDPELLLIMFRNLLDNAIKYTRSVDRIAVRAVEDSLMVLVEVADTGIGIPTEDLPHVFEDLYRASNARSVSGSGLGLALVQRIITLHGGRIEINSRLAQGTVIKIRLPLVSKSAS